MGRPGVFGREIVLTKEGIFAALNIGYNFYCEHESGVDRILMSLNSSVNVQDMPFLSLWLSQATRQQKKQIKAEIKKRKKEFLEGCEKMQRFRNTPYGEYIIHPAVGVFKREVTIHEEYAGGIMPKGDYTVIEIRDSNKFWLEKVLAEHPRDLNETHLMYTPDYAGGSNLNNYGFVRAGAPIKPTADVYGAWQDGSGCITVYIRRGTKYRDTGNQLIKALKNGTLALLPELRGVIHDRGCILADLDACYLGKRA